MVKFLETVEVIGGGRKWDYKAIAQMFKKDLEEARKLIKAGKKVKAMQYDWEEILEYYSGDKKRFQESGKETYTEMRRVIATALSKDEELKKLKFKVSSREKKVYIFVAWLYLFFLQHLLNTYVYYSWKVKHKH